MIAKTLPIRRVFPVSTRPSSEGLTRLRETNMVFLDVLPRHFHLVACPIVKKAA